jgi:hypothetical protein
MAEQIRPLSLKEKIRQSAEQHYLSGGSIENVPWDMLDHEQEWAQEFRLCEFEHDCERAA